MELLDYELKHINEASRISSECTLFLTRNNSFPIKAKDIALFGSGVIGIIKGGTGSGDVNSRYFINILEAFTEAKFNVLSKDWLEKYQEIKANNRKAFIKETKKRAHKELMLSFVYAMGCSMPESEYDLNLDYDTDTAIYVLARDSGEGNDRRPIKGDVLLTDTEIRDILYLDKHYKHFMLVLNVGGVVDLSPVKDVSNILLLSQLGVSTSRTLVDIVLGKVNPSGKLTTTWAKYSEYQTIGTFGDRNDVYYNEGIYVGYKYFDSFKKEVLFPFGYGLSYSSFDIKPLSIKHNKNIITVSVEVKNISKVSGKEVVEVYITEPIGSIDKPYQKLVGFGKTKELKENESEIVNVSFDISYIASFDSKKAINVLEKGNYVVRVGNSSRNTKESFIIKLDEDIVTSKLENKLVNNDIKELKNERKEIEYKDLETICLTKDDFKTNNVGYKYSYKVNPIIKNLSNEDLAEICTGNHAKGSITAIVGESSEHVPGAAGETTIKVKELNKCLVMSDGPAGIRVLPEFGKDSKGIYNVTMDKMMISFCEYLPKFVKRLLDPSKNLKKRHGEIIHQYTTAIPIGTALAQSFSKDVLLKAGNIIGEEMDHFNIDLWLAPALNIHRSILCGRNFEYYSEDPILSGLITSYITKGVESHKGRGVTIKHFACNNQEFNRNNNNSNLSERAIREIYIKGFEIAIKESNPKSIMTSYNLINGVHASESYELCTDILRSEWGYKGLVMTDWIQSGRSFNILSKYKAPYASLNIKAGNDLTMPGNIADTKDILKAIKKGKLSREELELSASRIFDFITNYK